MGIQEDVVDTWVLLGDTDHGKSTVLGQMLLLSTSLPASRRQRYRSTARTLGKRAALMQLADQLHQEREQQSTSHTTRAYLRTPGGGTMRILDVPGQQDRVMRVVAGMSRAQAGVLVVDAAVGGTEQTRLHIQLAAMSGLQGLLLVVNKMDCVRYSRTMFAALREQIESWATQAGVTLLGAVPVSGLHGYGIAKKSLRLWWHRGPSVLQALQSVPLDTADCGGYLVQDVRGVQALVHGWPGACGHSGHWVRLCADGNREPIDAPPPGSRILPAGNARRGEMLVRSDCVFHFAKTTSANLYLDASIKDEQDLCLLLPGSEHNVRIVSDHLQPGRTQLVQLAMPEGHWFGGPRCQFLLQQGDCVVGFGAFVD